MNKTELVSKVAEGVGCTKKEAGLTLDVIVSSISEALAKGEKVSLVGFGSFESTLRKARTCKNFKTGEPVAVPAKYAPKFKPAKALKTSVALLPVE